MPPKKHMKYRIKEKLRSTYFLLKYISVYDDLILKDFDNCQLSYKFKSKNSASKLQKDLYDV